MAKLDHLKKDQIHVKNKYISGVQLKLKFFPMQLASQSLLQYWDLNIAQVFNEYLNRNILMIFGKSRSFEKNCQIHVKHTLISDENFEIEFPNATSQSKSFALLRPW